MSAWTSFDRVDGRDVAVPERHPFGVMRSIFDPPDLGTVEHILVWPLLFMSVSLVRFRLARHPVFRRHTLRIVKGGRP